MENKEFKKVFGLSFEKLNDLVTEEATKLKANATKKELAQLKFRKLETQDPQRCIYGQITGDCFSDRAVTLIKTSCKKIFNANFEDDNIKGTISGSPKNKKRNSYWSPIEVFIDQARNINNGNNKRLIDYLKGKEKNLKLK